jgi:hypothetical protein
MRAHPDSPARFWASAVLVAVVAIGVLIAACGSMTFPCGVSLAAIATLAFFIAKREAA